MLRAVSLTYLSLCACMHGRREKKHACSEFTYTGSVESGTLVVYGGGFKVSVSASQYRQLLKHFDGRRVPCGTSRTDPPRGSLGEWLMSNITKTAIASYVGAILTHEGYAEKRGSYIKFR